jgi:predicted esterase
MNPRAALRCVAVLLATVAVIALSHAEADSPELPELVAAWLAGDEDARAALLEHEAADVARALRAHAAFPAHEPGVTRVSVECPDGFERPMWVRVPEGYDPSRPWPLVVCLHGGVSGAPLFGTNERPAPGEGMLMAIAAYLPEEARESAILLGVSAGARETQPDAVWWAEQGQQNILHFIAETRQRLNVDDDRVFVTGFSDGASGSFALAMRVPDTFAGYLPMFGNLLVAGADGAPIWVENLKGLNIRASNGGQDTLYPTRRMQPLIEQANRAGAAIDFQDYPEDGHVFTPGGAAEVEHFGAELLGTWRRDLLPRQVDWTTQSTARGRRAWVVIEEIVDGGVDRLPNVELDIPPPPARLGVQLDAEQEAPTIESVVEESPAAQAGVRAGDVVVRLGDDAIGNTGDLRRALAKFSAGDEFTLTVRRGDELLELSGRFVVPEREAAEPPVSARVMAEFTPGMVTLQARNAARVSILIAPEMLDEHGQIEVRLVGPDGETQVLRAAAEVNPDTATVLAEHRRLGDRCLPWIARLSITLPEARD